MAKINIGDQTQSFTAALANTTYVLSAGDKIATNTSGILAYDPNVEGRALVIGGEIDASQMGIQIGYLQDPLPSIPVEITKTGYVHADGIAIALYGEDHSLDNKGFIQGQTGVLTGKDAHVVNSGTIVADTFGISASGDVTVVNSGLLIGKHGAALQTVSGETATFRNSGTVGGSYSAVMCYDGDDRVINTGTLNGAVLLGNGDDTFIFTRGTLNGVVIGGGGDDTYVIGVRGVEINEDNAINNDVVKASVSLTLANYIEKLVLTGNKDLNATGNFSDNTIRGNSGDNRINAGDGKDVIDGGRGNDMLRGGLGMDTFDFNRGTGRDTVLDFENGQDRLDLSGLDGISGFADLMKNHVTVKGDDLWIGAGDDVVVLRDTARAELDTGDFIF